MNFPEFEPGDLRKAKASRRRRSDAGRPHRIYQKPGGGYVVVPTEHTPEEVLGWKLIVDVRR